jgi:hypothetical protein
MRIAGGWLCISWDRSRGFTKIRRAVFGSEWVVRDTKSEHTSHGIDHKLAGPRHGCDGTGGDLRPAGTTARDVAATLRIW